MLVDGERLNTARQATDRTGAEAGLISPDSISRVEIINGAGMLLYGTITVMRLDITSNTEQRVWTPGATFYRDRSSDPRTTSTLPSLGRPGGAGRAGPRGRAAASARGARACVDRAPGAGAGCQPARHRGVCAGRMARPAIDLSTRPDAAGATYSRKALTGDIGVVANPDGAINPFVRFGRSYRHPNLEEMLFAGPATAGNIVPNVKVVPETGNNFDAGVKFRAGRVSGGAYYFLNQYQNFIAQDLVVATNASGALTQATNYGDVRITGLELSAAAPLVFRPGVLTLTDAAALTRGTITDGVNPLDKHSLADTPFDNITPSKVILNARFTQSSGRWWMEYGVRSQTEVKRVAERLLDSPFPIAQDLLSLDGFTVQRAALGINLARGRDRVGLVFAVENLGDTYYREHFQFAPARGRSFTVGLNVGTF